MDTTSFLMNPFKQMQKFRTLTPVVRNYPEIIHTIILFNCSPGMVRLVDLFKGLFRRWFQSWFSGNVEQYENDVAKIQISRVGDWSAVPRNLHVSCIEANVASVASHS